MANWTVQNGTLKVGDRLRTGAMVTLLGAPEGPTAIPVTDSLTATQDGFTASLELQEQAGADCAYIGVTLQVAYAGAEAVERGLRVAYDLQGPGRPTWLVPGAFYKENRLSHCTRIYPRYDFEGGDPQQLVSDHWAFRADRTALPAVFAWNEAGCAALATAETSSLGVSGVGFRGNAEGTSIWLDFPYREEPVVFAAPGRPAPADCPLHRWQPGETVTLRYRVYTGGADLHTYDPFVRQLYRLDAAENPLNPWMGVQRAADLTAHGLFRWHYHPTEHILYETAAFDREFNGNVKGQGDRPNMHVGWVSGAPYAYALLNYAHKHGRADYAEAAVNVLNKIASGVAPCGLFWGEWRADRGWSQGWSPKKFWLQTRTLAEATLFMIRALRIDPDHSDWRDAVKSNLRYIVANQREDGCFGTYYHAETGEVMEWDGAGGVLWIAALLEAGAQWPAEADALAGAARKAGAYYRRFIEDEFIYGAPEDVHLTPTSEDGYNAVIAYVLLYEADRSPEWLGLAARAADWTMTFRWTYNLAFPRHSMLGQFSFRSRGADQASPSNQHLHNYGLIALPEFMRLWRHTSDNYYLARTRDNLACFLQFIAREDGDFNAYKGMVTERYYNTNCFQPKGMLLTLSHAWSVGVTLYAALEALAFEKDLNLPAD